MAASDLETSRFRVVFVTPTLGGGGAEMQVVRLANSLPDHLYEIMVVGVRSGGVYEERMRHGIRIEHLTQNIRSSSLSGMIARKGLVRLLEAFRADIAIGLLPQTIGLLERALRVSRIPVQLVIGVQNNVDRDRPRALEFLAWVDRYLMRAAVSRAARVVVISRGLCDLVHERFRGSVGKTAVVYNAGYDDAVVALANAVHGYDDVPRPLLVSCGRLHRQKDYPTLLRALADLRTRVPAHLWIAGDGPERERLREHAVALNVGDQVRFLGFQRNPYALMALGNAFVLSSQWEGFGNVLVEAMACGAAVVSTDCDYGPREIVEDGISGVLTPIGDARLLSAAIEKVICNRGFAERLRDGAKSRVKLFDAEASARGYDTVFREVLQRRSLRFGKM